MKKAIYHSEFHNTRKGRVFNALLSFLTLGRFSLIFTFKITIVKREFQGWRARQRFKEHLYIFLVLFPLSLAVTLGLQQCKDKRYHLYDKETDSIQSQRDTLSVSPHSLRSFVP